MQDTKEKVAALGIAAEALRENFQSRLLSTDQHVQDVRVQMIDVMKDLQVTLLLIRTLTQGHPSFLPLLSLEQETPEALFQEAQQRIDACNADLQVRLQV